MCYVDLESREKTDPESVHLINIDIQDNQEEATIGAFMICDLCSLVNVFRVFQRLWSSWCCRLLKNFCLPSFLPFGELSMVGLTVDVVD